MKNKYKIRQFGARTLSWWYNKRKDIDMNPSYQRRARLWSITDKAYLIDSIINGYDIPKFYLADFTWGDSKLNKKNLPYAIIDGKQRFEAIFDFFAGNIVLSDDFIYIDNPNLKLGGRGYNDLLNKHREIADEFQNYNLSVVSVYADNDEPINELFVRLNRSKPLTGAEVRNAMAGPAPEMIRKITKHEFFTTNIKFSSTRGQDLNAAAKILLFEYYNKFRDTTKNSLDEFVQGEAKKRTNKTRLELSGRYVIDILNNMSTIFLPSDRLLGSSGIIPVYYWLIKKIKERDYPDIREFLIEFERERNRYRKLIREKRDKSKIKAVYVDYDNLNRSTNSQTSHEGRYRILKQLFEKYNTINQH